MALSWISPRRVIGSLRERGVLGTVRFGAEHVRFVLDRREENAFDRRHGTDTSGIVELSQLRIASEARADGHRYQPISKRDFRRLLREAPLRYQDYTFVDMGSGKGRALLLAADYPFTRIVGVEFSPELCEIARRNVEQYARRTGRGERFEVVCGDAQAYDLPPTPVVLYLYNPFGSSTLAGVLDRIHAWYLAHPHDLVIFYRVPWHADLLEAAPFLRCVRATSAYVVYRGVRS